MTGHIGPLESQTWGFFFRVGPLDPPPLKGATGVTAILRSDGAQIISVDAPEVSGSCVE